MSAIYVEHPDGWVGIPESFPSEQWSSSSAWASDLVDVLARRFPEPDEGERTRLIDYLALIAGSRDDDEVSRLYVWVEGWRGPTYIAGLIVIPPELGAGLSVEALVGAEDPDAVEAPIVEEFVTATGLSGVHAVRYLDPPGLGGLLVREDYAWDTSAGFAQLFTAQYDLVAFERSRPRLEALARTVRVES